MNSEVALAKDLYSASVLDLDTVACFLALQDIRLEPKYTAKPPVDFLSSTHPAQSASKKSLMRVDFELLKLRPTPMACFTYRTILLTAVQCSLVGACKY